jgi:Domain of unknown function (DUF4388)
MRRQSVWAEAALGGWMADTFPVSGNIDPTSFPHLLVDLHRHGATGSLKINGPVFPKALYFRGGRILFGSSNDPRDQLGAILIESGKITREQLDDVNAKLGPGNPLAKVLAESGFVNQRELGDAARIKVERILSDVLAWSSGSFEFEDGVLPKGAVDLKLSTERLLLDAVQRIDDRSFALRHLGGTLAVVLERVPEAEATLSEVRAEVWPLLERLDGERTLNDAIALTRLDEFGAAKMACAMLFLGLVRRHEDGDELDLAKEARSGFGDESPPSPSAEDEPLGVQDESPSFDAPAPSGFVPPPAEPEPEPFGEAANGPAGATQGAEPEVFSAEAASPDFPVPFLAPEEPEPTLVMPEPPPPVPSWEPRPPDESGFAFVDDSRPPRPAPEVEPPAEEGPTSPTVSVSSPPAPIDFGAVPPRKTGTDTVPGDRPAYIPPPAPEPPVPEPPASAPEVSASPVEPAPSAPAARPTQQDLAALDALLNPSASMRVDRSADRSRPSWEPQFRSPSATTRARAVSRRPATQGESRTPVWAGLAVLVVVAAAGSYYMMFGRSSPPSPATPGADATPPIVASTPALSAPATVAAAPETLPTGAAPDAPVASTPSVPATPTPGAVAPAPAAVHPTPATAAPRPTPATPPVVMPTPAVARRPPSGSADEARALLRHGALAESARGFATSLATGPEGRFSVQALVACAPETVQKAVDNVSGAELFILPVDLKGRSCYRVCWGVYETRDAAESAARDLPSYFRQSGISPRVTPLVELLP